MSGEGTEGVVGRLRAAPTLAAVLVVVLGGLLLRLVALGGRVSHWDEGRVAYWILRYHETGQYYYRPIIHGPFLPVVNDYTFALLPATDATMRLPVALVGAALPLFAWLVRDRLDRAEVVALALLLAFNPLLVYYSRFMRSDVLAGGFALLALGLVVRAVDAGRPTYLVPAGAVFALSFTAKENALIYLVNFLGAGFLLLDHRVVRRAWREGSLADALVGGFAETGDRLARWLAVDGDVRRGSSRRLATLLLSPPAAVLAFFAVIVFFYAPRPEFWAMFAEPATAPDVLDRATVGAWERFYDTWGGGTHQSHDYLPYVHDLLESLVYGAPVVTGLGVVGFVADAYGSGRRRELVAFGSYIGAVSIVGYPVATDIQAPWVGVHVVLPLALPAAVGLGLVAREVGDSLDREDAAGAVLAGVVLLSVVAGVGMLNADYFNSAAEEDKQVLQWAQPGNDLQSSLEEVQAVARHNAGTDVLFWGTTSPYGDEALFHVANESSAGQAPVGGPAWHSRLPLPWYLERYDAEVASTGPDARANESLADAPPVVVTYAWDRDEVSPYLEGYTAHEHDFKLWGEHVVVFVEDDALAEARAAGAGEGTAT
jgi:uncharacterized protein (TIGR03663 family)